MMGMLRDSFRRRLGDDVLMDKGGGEENLRVARGDLGGSPYRSLLFWPLANRSSSDLWGGEGRGRKPLVYTCPSGRLPIGLRVAGSVSLMCRIPEDWGVSLPRIVIRGLGDKCLCP